MSPSYPAIVYSSPFRNSPNLTIHTKLLFNKEPKRPCEVELCYQDIITPSRLRNIRRICGRYMNIPIILDELHPEGIPSLRYSTEIPKKSEDITKHDGLLNQRKPESVNSSTDAPHHLDVSIHEKDKHISELCDECASRVSLRRHLQQTKENLEVPATDSPAKHNILVSGVNDPLLSDALRLGQVATLDAASCLNAYVPYMTMTFGAVSGAGLFSWEQSAETVCWAAIVPATLFVTTVLCTLGLPLSMLATDEIKDLQATARRCSEISEHDEHKGNEAAQPMNHIYTENLTERSKRRARSGDGDSGSDLEDSKANKPKCKCIRCMSNARRNGIYCALLLPPIFAGLAFILSMIALIALMFVTEKYKTAIIATVACMPATIGFSVVLGWLLYRRSGWAGKA